VLSGAGFGLDVDNLSRPAASGEKAAPRVGHFFVALDVARFMPVDEFRARLSALFEMLRQSRLALDEGRIYVHGEKEQVRAELHEKSGIPIAENVFETLRRIAADCGIDPPRTVAEWIAHTASVPREEGRDA
jgi:LDH2 family malate/lactate/ureidoglycolate dehydrogenase